MDITFFNIAIGISATIIGGLAFVNEIGKPTSYKIIKSLSFKIVIFIIASTFGIWATIRKDSTTELNSKIEQAERDSNNRIYTDESNRKMVETMINVLAQYGAKNDSSKNELAIIKNLLLKKSRINFNSQFIATDDRQYITTDDGQPIATDGFSNDFDNSFKKDKAKK